MGGSVPPNSITVEVNISGGTLKVTGDVAVSTDGKMRAARERIYYLTNNRIVTVEPCPHGNYTYANAKVTFVGQYAPFSIVASGATGDNEGNLNEIIMLGSGNRLGYSQNARTLKCFRCHFEVPTEDGMSPARSIVRPQWTSIVGINRPQSGIPATARR